MADPHGKPYDGDLPPDAPQMYAARVMCPAPEPCAECVAAIVRVLDQQQRLMPAEQLGVRARRGWALVGRTRRPRRRRP